MLVGVPWVLSFFQDSIWTISRPGVLSWLGAVDVLGVVVFYLWVIRFGPRRARSGPDEQTRVPTEGPARAA
jgi:alpha-1,2-mannosyltransferase